MADSRPSGNVTYNGSVGARSTDSISPNHTLRALSGSGSPAANTVFPLKYESHIAAIWWFLVLALYHWLYPSPPRSDESHRAQRSQPDNNRPLLYVRFLNHQQSDLGTVGCFYSPA